LPQLTLAPLGALSPAGSSAVRQGLPAETLRGRKQRWPCPTLFRCPFDPDPVHCDIGLVGISRSSDNGKTERD